MSERMSNEVPRSDSADGIPPPPAQCVIGVSSLETELGRTAEVKKAAPEDRDGGGGGDCVVIDVISGGGGGGEDLREGEEMVCRICHLSWERKTDGLDSLMSLGCGCKNDLGIAHGHCAEAWFKIKGNRYCEICGVVAKNITGVGDNGFMEAWNERRDGVGGDGNENSSEHGGCWRGQPFCNFLMTCLIIAFILPWFFRVNML
ncbi:hypothetical protein QJS10_CPB20g01690 [Acorus calamus]|uniref:RING-CH-type domain-containing protein n=1 Tax=Acorus calamus TaxID=4465 RepID=A0AAV9CD71_ACOCL|nr:hypothetical protein QJS10_CPB20g01690 [Acorus calamus]